MISIDDSRRLRLCLDRVRRSGADHRPALTISPAARRGATDFLEFVTIVRRKLNVSLMPYALNTVASNRSESFQSPCPAPFVAMSNARQSMHRNIQSRNSSISFCFDHDANVPPNGERSTLIVVELSKSL
jgi:hypothetical protein